jgi:NTE family protein
MGQIPSTTTDISDLLASLELFRDLDQSALEDLASEFERVHVVRGETLIETGGPGDCMYVVISGRLHAFIQAAGGQEQFVREMGPGETVGELALISGEERSATVRAGRDTELLRLSKSGFDRMVHRHPESLMWITRVVVDRLRHPPLASRAIGIVRTVGLLPAGADAPLRAFAHQRP